MTAARTLGVNMLNICEPTHKTKKKHLYITCVNYIVADNLLSKKQIHKDRD